MDRRLHIIGAATSAGAHGPGQEDAPQTLRRYGLVDQLTAVGLHVVDHGDVVRQVMRPDPDCPELRNVENVVAVAETVADHVQEIVREQPHDRILVLGGDCTIQLGIIAGAKAATDGAVGLAYIDLDCDLTSPVSGNGMADWMGVTHLLDAPDADPRLAGIGGQPPLITRDTLRLIAADLATPYERQRLDDLGLTRISSSEVEADPDAVVEALAPWTDGFTLLSVHVDVDVLDQTAFPIAEEQRDTPGLSVEALTQVVTALMAHPAARILTVCEINPSRPPEPVSAFAAVTGMITRALT